MLSSCRTDNVFVKEASTGLVHSRNWYNFFITQISSCQRTRGLPCTFTVNCHFQEDGKKSSEELGHVVSASRLGMGTWGELPGGRAPFVFELGRMWPPPLDVQGRVSTLSQPLLDSSLLSLARKPERTCVSSPALLSSFKVRPRSQCQ